MSQKHSFLLEIGVEELPAQALLRMRDTLKKTLVQELEDKQLNYGDMQVFATPRRLAILVKNLDSKQKDETMTVRGPAVAHAFDADGHPKGAAKGFAGSCGVDVSELTRIDSGKGEYLAYEKFVKGQEVSALIPEFVENIVKQLASAKTMRWGAYTHRFLRPVRWLTVLLDTDVIPCEVYGVSSQRETFGHRIHCPEAISLTHAEEYEPRLQSVGYVIPKFETRRQTILDQVNSIAISKKLTVSPDDDLVNEITGLVEWPVTLCGTFDESFLEVPHECLISTMEQNQKYLATKAANGVLTNTFLFVANLESTDPEMVITGNERVIRPRFADAKFFFETDKQKQLKDLRQGLARVIYQKELGSTFEKTERLAKTAVEFAQILKVDADEAKLAGELSKVDLLTSMVGEFPELQGTMGRYYAKAQGYSDSLAQALEEQYLPRGQGDGLPNSSLGILLSLADKFDALVGFFSIGQEPKADKDPFALRRMALGIVRMCIELELDLDVCHLAKLAAQAYGFENQGEIAEKVAIFIMQRLPTLYKDSGIDMRLVRAVEASKVYNPSDFNKRLVVLQSFYKGNDAAALAEVHKRANNILKKNAMTEGHQLQAEALSEPAEKALYEALAAAEGDIASARAKGDYVALLQLGASLREIVDAFFLDVKVMSDNPVEKDNRLYMLTQLQALFAEVGDLSYLA